jgi:hypothetical protein
MLHEACCCTCCTVYYVAAARQVYCRYSAGILLRVYVIQYYVYYVAAARQVYLLRRKLSIDVDISLTDQYGQLSLDLQQLNVEHHGGVPVGVSNHALQPPDLVESCHRRLVHCAGVAQVGGNDSAPLAASLHADYLQRFPESYDIAIASRIPDLASISIHNPFDALCRGK